MFLFTARVERSNEPMRIEKIFHGKKLIALVVHAKKLKKWTVFFTPKMEAVQLGMQNRMRGTAIKPHIHPPTLIKKAEAGASEVLYIIKGKVGVVFHTNKGT